MRQHIGPPGPPAAFAPQWAVRRLEREMDCSLGEVECRVCACTDSSACEGGCWWVEETLCSSCDQLRAVFPALIVADGHGIAALWVQHKLAWQRWAAELVAVAERYDSPYGARGPIAQCGEECWRSMFEHGYSPEEAFLEDMSYAD